MREKSEKVMFYFFNYEMLCITIIYTSYLQGLLAKITDKQCVTNLAPLFEHYYLQSQLNSLHFFFYILSLKAYCPQNDDIIVVHLYVGFLNPLLSIGKRLAVTLYL